MAAPAERATELANAAKTEADKEAKLAALTQLYDLVLTKASGARARHAPWPPF